jgi:hypothetical protein
MRIVLSPKVAFGGTAYWMRMAAYMMRTILMKREIPSSGTLIMDIKSTQYEPAQDVQMHPTYGAPAG